MRCPFCAYLESKVVDSRPIDDGSSIKRRRECLKCQQRFTTYEHVEGIHTIVVKKDKTREQFNRGKLLNGMIKACEKRPVSLDQLETAANEIEAALASMSDREITSDVIGELVMDKLKEIDEVSYVRFASVYRQFKDINTFLKEINKLLK